MDYNSIKYILLYFSSDKSTDILSIKETNFLEEMFNLLKMIARRK